MCHTLAKQDSLLKAEILISIKIKTALLKRQNSFKVGIFTYLFILHNF